MTKKVFALATQPGIQRDGTLLDSIFYRDGQWVRFQRGRPRKIGGYTQVTGILDGPSRGIYVQPRNGFNYTYSGYNNGFQSIALTDLGLAGTPVDYTLSNFTQSNLNLWQIDAMYDPYGTGNSLILAHPGQNLATIDSSTNTPVLQSATGSTTLSKIGVLNAAGSMSSGTPTVFTLTTATSAVGAGQTVTVASGAVTLPANTTVVSVVGTTVTLSNAGTFTGTQSATLQFDNNISVSGGVVVLYPYVFIYGNNGLIQNCAAGNTQNWVGADANANNVSSTKVVKGLSIRGGSNSPSGLFWALDSLIRVSYTPTTVTTGTISSTFYWRYDIISSQTSILSSSCVIEYDGIYYWIGTDRFLMYNGVVKEIPNNMNQNYFFDNLNYAQRQKVWACKVPRYGEIWWFYPRGDATECTDAIIYNVRENTWYDAGQALGAQRSAGFYTQVFDYPIMADWNVNNTGIATLILANQGSGYTNGTYSNVPLLGGSGSNALATLIISGNKVTSVTLTYPGFGYAVSDLLTVNPATVGGTGAGFTADVSQIVNFTNLWQHEVGTDAIENGLPNAIPSFFETNSLGWNTGGPSQQQLGNDDNYWLRLERLEPDFILQGNMDMYITGRPFAQSADLTTGPYTFDSTTNKIDLKEQRRELRLRFVSNQTYGTYQLGRLILSGEFGDVRGY
jgi:hypothetical protein